MLSLRRLFRRRRVEQELDQELRFHLEKQTEANVAAGMAPEEARRQALVALGGMDKTREEYRDALGLRLLFDFAQDVRYALRQMRRSPGFTAVAVLSLGLGIGANTAIFTVLNAVLLRPLAFPEPDRIVRVLEFNRRHGGSVSVSPVNFEQWRKQSRSFTHIAALWPKSFVLAGDRPERLLGGTVSPGFFEVLGIRPALGRTFAADEETAGRDQVVILAHGLWKRRFGSDPAVLGRTITLNGASFLVAGVMPEDFSFPSRRIDLWAPLVLDRSVERRNFHYLSVIARLKPGVTAEQASGEVDTISRQTERQNPQPDPDQGAGLVRLREQMVENFRPVIFILFAAVIFVLLIGCADVANLLLARATARQKEIAVRLAMGAGRLRLVRQFLTESVLLALVAGALGLLLSRWGVRSVLALNPGIPRAYEIGPDWQVLAFTAGISLLAGVAFGCLPALRCSSPDLSSSLKEGGTLAGGSQRGGVRSLLVVSQIGLSVVLLIGAGLLIRSLLLLESVDPGFRPERVLAFQLSAPQTTGSGSPGPQGFFRDVLARIETIPGVAAAGATDEIPFGMMRTTRSFEIEGQAASPFRAFIADVRIASPGYFRAMGIPLLLGRGFAERDGADAPKVAIVNELMARRFFPNQSPLGKRIETSTPPALFEIIGVVGNVKQGLLRGEFGPEIYLSWLQRPAPELCFAVRTAGEPASLVPALRTAVREVNRDQPIYAVRTMEQAISDSITAERFNALLLGGFAAMALLLAVIGTYGVIAYSVEQRRHEIGIRMALGAQRGDVIGLIMKQGTVLALAGLAAGSAGALAVSRLLTGMLYGVGATDPLTFAAVAFLLGAAALLAAFIPARRAARADPMVALRYE
jgi:putative ABC transport system permease protein